MDKLKQLSQNYPRLTSWLVLAVGMVLILIWSAWDVGFTAGQWLALVITTILLAGACVWIIYWGDDEAESESAEEA
jgi:hypothetical protein